MVLNGALAGLVGVTAGADVVTPGQAVVIGGVAGAVVVLAVIGSIGDGKIFVVDLVQCIRIRTGETGMDAIGGSRV